MTEHNDNDEYRKLMRISYSGLKHLARSPAHYWHWFNQPEDPPTPAKLFGNLVHTLVLEPTQYEERFVVGLDHDRKSKANKAAWAEFEASNEGKKIITAAQLSEAQSMAEAVRKHPRASLVLSGGVAEQTILWTDPDTGAECKGRFDYANTTYGLLSDLKTTTDARWDKFAKDVYNYDYYVQGAFYLDGYNAANGTNYEEFILIAVEKEAPYELICHTLDADALALGRMFYKPLLEKYVECVKSGVWHGYDTRIQSLSLPRWAFK